MGQALRLGAARLAEAGLEDPAREARLLMAHAAGLERATLLDRGQVAPEGFTALLERRAAREPLAYITGRQGFWSLELDVSPATLIPRADSETLIEAALAARPERARVASILDLGTGTGCLLLAGLSEYAGAWGIGIDRVPGAVVLAAGNARRTGLAARSAWVAGDWAASIEGRFDLVLSNPPYIPGADVAGLMPEVSRHEPRGALDGGADGLAAYRALLAVLPGLLAPGGLAVFELGVGQAGAVQALAREAGFRCALRSDLGGVDRALLLEKEVGIGAWVP